MNIVKARVVFPNIEKYRRFNGTKSSINNGQIIYADDVPEEVMSYLEKEGFLTDIVERAEPMFYVVYRHSHYPNPWITTEQYTEAEAVEEFEDTIITLIPADDEYNEKLTPFDEGY